MLKIENWEVVGWEHAIRGVRNPMNSWDRSDSYFWHSPDVDHDKMQYEIGDNDHDLLMRLRNAGTDHRKFMRMITVYLDITAPLYWWKEFKTYRAGRKFGDPEPDVIDPELLEMDIEMNSCSTMHKIHAKEFTLDDFSHEHLTPWNETVLGNTIVELNANREAFLESKSKDYWWQMIQLLPSSYNQKRTVMLNYEVLANIYKSRRNHKLDEWHVLCDWIEKLPYSELIIGEKEESTKLKENDLGFLECTNCHKVFGNIPLVESAAFTFCPYCGKKFNLEE